MQWGDIVSDTILQNNKIYTTSDLYDYFKYINPSITYADFRWKLFHMVKNKEITKVGVKSYVVGYVKYDYEYESAMSFQIDELLSKEFENLDTVIWETRILNEWMNLQITNNTIVIEVERIYAEFVFEKLMEHFANATILLNPSKEEFLRYQRNDIIVIRYLVSRSPLRSNSKHIMLEKLAVDLLSDKFFSYLFESSVISSVIGEISKGYILDEVRLLAYAKRKHKYEEAKKCLRNAND